MSETNWKELAVQQANLVSRMVSEKRLDMDKLMGMSESILALAQPEQQPMKWLGVVGEPEVINNWVGFCVRQYNTDGGWCISSPTYATPAAAIAAWNETIRAMGGVDGETVRLVGILRGYCDRNKIDHGVELADAWLASHGGGGA